MASRLGGNASTVIVREKVGEKAMLLKRMLDVTFSLVVIGALLPLLLVVAVAVKLESKGPVIFKQKREGLNGKVFTILKFRSMKSHSDDQGFVVQAKVNDHRVTRVGRFIRKTSIDELPQFFNVLAGDMSVVGPRPHAISHNEYYKNIIKDYDVRSRVKPGITGLAQVKGFRGETETVEKMESRIAWDVKYVQQWTLWLDVKIIIKTPLSLLFDKAY